MFIINLYFSSWLTDFTIQCFNMNFVECNNISNFWIIILLRYAKRRCYHDKRKLMFSSCIFFGISMNCFSPIRNLLYYHVKLIQNATIQQEILWNMTPLPGRFHPMLWNNNSNTSTATIPLEIRFFLGGGVDLNACLLFSLRGSRGLKATGKWSAIRPVWTCKLLVSARRHSSNLIYLSVMKVLYFLSCILHSE